VLAGLHSGLGKGEDYLAILLTAPGDADADTWNAGASASWHRFTTYFRRAWGGTYGSIEFWRVAELQQRGLVHFHVVVRGVRFVPITNRTGTGLRDIAVAAGFGPFVGVRRPRDYPGGVKSLGFYFGKYLLKAYTGAIGITKLVTFSHGWRVTWEDRKRHGPSEWAYVPRSVAFVDYFGVLGDDRCSVRPRQDEDFFAWWRHSWQSHRERWAPTIDMGL